MKIYDEVTIDMNPESLTYGKHLSEESHEYNGDISLCAGAGTIDVDRGKGYGRPGLTTLGRGAHGGKMPGALPSNIFQVGIPGVMDKPAGALGQGDTPFGTKHDPGFWATKEGRTPHYQKNPDNDIFQQVGIGIENLLHAIGGGIGIEKKQWDESGGHMMEDDQNLEFKNWYEDYIGKAIDAPATQFREQGFQRASELGLDPSVLAGYGGDVGGIDTLEGEGPLVAKGLTGDITTAQYDLEQQIKDERLAQEGYDEDLTTLKSDRMKAITGQDLMRTQALTQQGTQAQQRAAAIAKTGMAYSGPAEVAARMGEEAGQFDLASIAKEKQNIQEKYGIAKADIEGSKIGAESDLEGFRRDFGVKVQDVLEGSTSDLQDLMTGLGGLPQAHSAFGESIDASLVAPDWSGEGTQQKSQVADRGKLFGRTQGDAPAEGWFTEGYSRPSYLAAESDVTGADSFARWIMNEVGPEAFGAGITEEG